MFKEWRNKFRNIFFNRIPTVVTGQATPLRQMIAEEMRLPDIKWRHLFTARLRLIVFVAVWVILVLFYTAIWKTAPLVPFLFNLGFLVTAFCYWIVIRSNQILLSIFVVEILADVISQTALVYLLGLHSAAPFLVYGLYVVAVGITTGYIASLFASTAILVCYNLLFILEYAGVLAPFVYQQSHVGLFDLSQTRMFIHLIFLPLILALIIYTVRIANYFLKIREDALEFRNVQLNALNLIGSTIRHAVNINKVIKEILKAVIQGLGFDICLLALVDQQEQRIMFYAPEGDYFTTRLEEILGVSHRSIRLPLDLRNNSVCIALKKNRVLVRNSFAEIIYGAQPEIPMHNALRAQKILGFKKFVITPLVAEQKVIGAIIGATKKLYIEDTIIDTLDNFANQVALALESSQLIEELQRKNRELVKADKIKSEFLAVMSHELRTPLNAVLGYTEAMLDASLGPLTDDQKKSLSEIMRNGQSLLDLINSVLDLAKIESGKMEINLDDFDAVELAETTRSSLAPLLNKKQQVFTIHPQSDLPRLRADAVKVRQILTNLIGNAIKFTPTEGEIDMFIEYHESCQGICREHFASEEIAPEVQTGPAFLIRVRDTGMGIKQQDLQAVFEIFKQADSSHTRTHGGTGLGLALTKELVTLHSGFIVAASEMGKGSEFKILLPQN